MTIRNPVLPGFHPDPSIIRVGDDFYLATSTFEWFPGVALFHSRDLAHWRPIGHALTRVEQLDLRGVPDSGGLWAPSLSHDGERFYLVVCHLRTRSGPFKDMRVMLYHAERIEGPWSDGICIARSGFDPSLFHDPTTGRKWLLNIQWDYRQGMPRFAGIVIQEFDPQLQACVGALRTILTKPVLIEGPNLYHRDGWYYLMCAEGGTGWNHGISVARSRVIEGPYEVDPEPLITTRNSPGLPLQKAGHGEIVQTQSGQWYLAHLASRPIYPERRSLLGRETCLQEVRWTSDSWLRLAQGGHEPLLDVPSPLGLSPHPFPMPTSRDDFTSTELGAHWQSPRVPIREDWASLRAVPGRLRLRGRESLHSQYEQSLVARRIQSADCVITTRIEFAPTHFTQSAGLVIYYDTRQHFYLRLTHDERTGGRVLGVVQTDDGTYTESQHMPCPIRQADQGLFLRAVIQQRSLQFMASTDGITYHHVGPAADFTKLSDDYGSTMRFTGPMAGICCQDLNEARITADFEFFEIVSAANGA